MQKSNLIVQMAGLADDDPKIKAVSAVLNGEKQKDKTSEFRLYRPGEAAKALGVSRTTLWRMTQEGRLQTVEVRKGSCRYPEAELRRLAQGERDHDDNQIANRNQAEVCRG